MTGPGRQPPIFGLEPWATVAGAKWCHFDRWFALVAVTAFAGDLEALEHELVGRLRSSLHGRDDVEAKLSHLADQRARMAVAGVDAADLAAPEEGDKATLAKARRNVLDQALEGRAMTEDMRDTPRVQLDRRARYGHWGQFPVNPDRWHEKLAGRRSATHVSKGRSFAVTRQLRERLARYDGPRRGAADRLALYRAFHTVGVELAERGDDSYGNIGELRLDAFRTYLGIDWAATAMEPGHYWQDLCELLVSEVYALTYQHETLPFRHVPAGQADMIETVLLGLADEWRAAYQDYQADEALVLVAWLHIAGRRYTRYADAARRLGSDHWMPIVALAESAVAAGRTELAVDVFTAADQPGMHRDHLRDRCLELTGVRLDDRQTDLRVVK
ncbi:MAG: hypothetical protein ACT452_12095 [Microthrixaceae bacterium]